MNMVQSNSRIPEAVLAEQWYALIHRVIELLQARFRQSALSKKDIARRIGKEPSFVSRCFSGQQNMTLRTLHAIARAMGCRLDITLTPLDELKPANRSPTSPPIWATANDNPYITDTGSDIREIYAQG